jgi:hypothetical protein
MRTNHTEAAQLQPRFIVGCDRDGCWIVRDRLDRIGGLFTSEDAARHFALEESDHDMTQVASARDEVSLTSIDANVVH